MRSALGSPEPKTTCVRPSCRRQRVQPAWAAAYSASEPGGATSGTPTRAAAASASGSAEARLLGGAVSREHGELAIRLRRAAVGAARVGVLEAHELLEMALALHANELVDRHRCRSVGTRPDAPQGTSRRGWNSTKGTTKLLRAVSR